MLSYFNVVIEHIRIYLLKRMEFASSVIVIITAAYVFPQGIRDVVML